MAKFDLTKSSGGFYIKFFEKGLTSINGTSVRLNLWLKVRELYSSAPDSKTRVVIGNKIFERRALYDFLRDEGKEVVSGPRGNNSAKQFTTSDGVVWKEVTKTGRIGRLKPNIV